MKNKVLSIFVLALLFFTTSCDEQQWPVSDVKLVPIYQLTNIVGTNAPYSIEIYKEKPLLVEFSNAVNVKSLAYSNYADLSTELNYNMKFKATEKSKSILGADTLLTRRYELNGVKASNTGTLKIVKYNKTDSTTNSYTIKIADASRYN